MPRRRSSTNLLLARAYRSLSLLIVLFLLLVLLDLVLAITDNLTPGVSSALLIGVPALAALLALVYVIEPKSFR